MHKTIQPADIPPNNPFRDDVDFLGRRKAAELLTALFSSMTHSCVVSVDADWGRGKTFFLTQLTHHLRNENYVCAYLNAWESDFVSDPLVAFMSGIRDAIANRKETTNGGIESHLKTLRTVAPKLAKTGITAIVRAATCGALDLSDTGIESVLADAIGDSTKDLLDSYQDMRNSIDQFRQELAQLASSASSKNEDDTARPIVCIIDELDRCRPSFAIEYLERIKHLFSVDGIIFVLGLDKKQLSQAIRAVYGKIDSDGYLRRFIDIEYQLPNPGYDAFVNYLTSKHEIASLLRDRPRLRIDGQIDAMQTVLAQFSSIYSLTPRDIEKIVYRVSLVLRVSSSPIILYAALVAALVCLRYGDQATYDNLRSRNINWPDVANNISMKDWRERCSEYPMSYVNAYLKFGFLKTRDAALLLNGSTSSGQYSNDELEVLTEIHGSLGNGILSSVFDRIEMIQNFKS